MKIETFKMGEIAIGRVRVAFIHFSRAFIIMYESEERTERLA